MAGDIESFGETLNIRVALWPSTAVSIEMLYR